MRIKTGLSLSFMDGESEVSYTFLGSSGWQFGGVRISLGIDGVGSRHLGKCSRRLSGENQGCPEEGMTSEVKSS